MKKFHFQTEKKHLHEKKTSRLLRHVPVNGPGLWNNMPRMLALPLEDRLHVFGVEQEDRVDTAQLLPVNRPQLPIPHINVLMQSPGDGTMANLREDRPPARLRYRRVGLHSDGGADWSRPRSIDWLIVRVGTYWSGKALIDWLIRRTDWAGNGRCRPGKRRSPE